MHVAWEQTWPRWVGVACFVFGIANVAGALTAPIDIMLPGVVIGLVWAIVGLKRGLPLFVSAPQGMLSPSERITLGLRAIRRRRLVAFAAVLAWLPVSAFILPHVPEKFIRVVFFLIALPLGALSAVWMLSACPRCDHHFFPVVRRRLFVSFSRCYKCGLGLHDA